jgi:hypothetical protein
MLASVMSLEFRAALTSRRNARQSWCKANRSDDVPSAGTLLATKQSPAWVLKSTRPKEYRALQLLHRICDR